MVDIEIASDTVGSGIPNGMTAVRMTSGIDGHTGILIQGRGGGAGRGRRLRQAGVMIIVNAIGIVNVTIAGSLCKFSKSMTGMQALLKRYHAVSAVQRPQPLSQAVPSDSTQMMG